MKSVPAIAFDYRPSRWLLLAIAVIAALALVAIVLCGLNSWIKLALATAVLAYALHSSWQFLHPRFAHVMWHSAGHWRLRDAAEHEQVGELRHAVVLGALIVLVLRVGPKRTCSFALLPDNVDEEARRRLRVRLARTDSIDGH
ncbi:protein YgfX [Rudaea sp.]|uniref:protein YgfX n=1 Tax=Rudaea sp. TaxID=2136325 RepID=UPI002ED1A2C6